MASLLCLKKAVLGLSLKNARIFTSARGSKTSNDTSNNSRFFDPSFGFDIEDSTQTQVSTTQRSRSVSPNGQEMASRSFVYPKWRHTDARGLIQGVGDKELKPYSANFGVEVYSPRSGAVKKCQYSDTFGVASSMFRVTKTTSLQQSIKQAEEINATGFNDSNDPETAKDAGVGFPVVGVKDGNDQSVKGYGDCKEKHRKMERDSNHHSEFQKGYDENTKQVVKKGGEAVDSKGGPHEKDDDGEAVWGRGSYPYTRLF